MFYYAITINRNHQWFTLEAQKEDDPKYYATRDVDIGFLCNVISQKIESLRYLELVIHHREGLDYHIHGLIISDEIIPKELISGCCHIETVINLPKYKAYMTNHDVLYHKEFGDMPFINQEAIKEEIYQEMLRYYFSCKSAVKTVQRFGLVALKYFRALKDMEIDIQ